MVYQGVNEIKFKADEYINFSYYDKLYEKFAQKMELRVIDSISFTNKYLLATIVACIEGHIYLDTENNSWYSWLLDKRERLKDDDSYVLLNICEFIKLNKDFFDFITKYFNLWHDTKKDSEFIYDKNHKKQLEENFAHLIYVIEKDIKEAINKKDKYIVELYNKLHNVLIDVFNKSKNYSFKN